MIDFPIFRKKLISFARNEQNFIYSLSFKIWNFLFEFFFVPKSGSESRNFQIKNWVTRKYTFNMIVRLSVELFLRKMAHQNQNYCFSNNSKQSYVKNAQEIKALNPQLIPIRNKFIDALIEIQRSNFGFKKLGTLCWYEKL